MMAHHRIALGLLAWPNPPLGLSRVTLLLARLLRLDSILVADHFQSWMPTAIWDREISWVSPHYPSPHEVFDYQVLLGYLAHMTSRQQIGVGVTEAIRRHPVLIAQAMLTVAHMVKRPPILGIGAGERENTEPYGLEFCEPVSRLEEALRIIRLCFSSHGPIVFAGKYYHLDGAIMDLRPPKGRTPRIWIAGHGPRMLRLTGKYGDGWFPTLVSSPHEYKTDLQIVKTAACDAGRDPKAITPALHQFVAVASSEQEARAMVRSKLARLAAFIGSPASEWRKLGAEHPISEHFRGYIDFIPERYSRATLEEAIAAVPSQLIGRGWVVGTPDQVVARLRAFGEAGARHIVLSLPLMLVSRRAAIYSQIALPRIALLLRKGH